MNNDYDLYQELNSLQQELTSCIRQLRVEGVKLAQAEMDYKIRLRQEALKLRANDTPITLIQIVVYGDEEVAKLRFARDSQDAIYKAIQENINTIKLRQRLIDNQITRELGNTR